MTAPASLLVLASAIRDVHETEPLGSRTAPLVLPSTTNLREHHRAKAKRTKAHRDFGFFCGRIGLALVVNKLPVVVLLTRQAPRPLDDDNLAAAFKAVRDGVADWLGVDDRDPRVTWLYAQRKGPAMVEVGFWRRHE